MVDEIRDEQDDTVVEPAEIHRAPVVEQELTAADILGYDDIVTEKVFVPEWGGAGKFVLVRGMMGNERDAWEVSLYEEKRGGPRGRATVQMKRENVRAGLVAKCIVSSAGVRLFTDGDIAKLGRKSAAALSRVYDVASRLSGVGEQDVDELAADFSEAPTAPSILG